MKGMSVLLLLISVLFWGFAAEGKLTRPANGLKLIFKPVFRGGSLCLHTQAYIDFHGDTLYVDALRFYISSIMLKSKDGGNYKKIPGYHLIDAEDSTTESIRITGVDEGTYTAIRFQIGVDSLTNVSGALDGDLDPAKGMYWAWNTGYIHAKLEGHAKVCPTLHQEFEFHIGGYLPPYQTIRSVELDLGTLKIRANGESVLTLHCDVSKWLAETDLAKTNSVLIPGRQAMKLADNYKEMFSVCTIY